MMQAFATLNIWTDKDLEWGWHVIGTCSMTGVHLQMQNAFRMAPESFLTQPSGKPLPAIWVGKLDDA